MRVANDIVYRSRFWFVSKKKLNHHKCLGRPPQRSINDNGCYDIASPIELVHFLLRELHVNKGSRHHCLPFSKVGSARHDGVSSLECVDYLAEPLSTVYTQSLTEKCYPDAFKIGQLTPVYKSGRKTDVKYYRGVNVMPNLAKVVFM